MEDNYKYMVMKMRRTIQIIDNTTGKENDYEIEGLAGFVPIFNTIEEAEQNSNDGKFEIVKIKAV